MKIVLSLLGLLIVITLNAQKNEAYHLKTVVIDAGHGGKDNGCLGGHSKEKEIALKIALQTGKYIKAKYPKVKVVYTRTTDVFIPLHKRAEIANKNKADLFVSIHCNAFPPDSSVYGTETFVMGLHTVASNLAVAKRENEVILLEDNYQSHYDGFDPNSPEGHIILSMYQNAHLEQSILFASKVEAQFKYRVKRHSRGVKQAGFVVLKATAMPSALVEVGFLTNAQEEAYLMTLEGQTYISSAIYRAFKAYKEAVEAGITMPTKYVKTKPSKKIPPKKSTTKKSATKKKQQTAELASPPKQMPLPKIVLKQPVVLVPNKNKVIYKVQVATATKLLNTNTEKWKAIDMLETDEVNGVYKYLSTGYINLAEAIEAQKQLRQKGFEGAFVVAYKNGRRISMKEAKKQK